MDSELALGTLMYACRNCRVIDSSEYDGPPVRYWTLLNGTTMRFPRVTIHLSSDFVPCDVHRQLLESTVDGPVTVVMPPGSTVDGPQ